MNRRLQIKFDPNQDYQLEAIESVIRLFEGTSRRITEFALSGEIIQNIPQSESFSESWLRDNLREVQEQNNIVQPSLGLELEVDDGLVLQGAGDESWRYPSFTIEMETGTGKTYVYLRTIYELRKHYGFSKFIIVVPSIAIYEGVIKNFEITKDHFRAIYGNEIVNLVRYDGSQLSRLRSFATSTFTEVLVITLDSFNKASNNIYKTSEKLPGERKPYQFIQELRPILILDEPQNMESPRSKEALRTLHPLLALRYSATHRTSPNLIYRLTPFDAYRRDLVKKIQVLGVTERENFNQPFLALKSISLQNGIMARVTTYLNDRGRTREADIILKQGDDLYTKTGHEEHKDGYRVAEINAANNIIQFDNGLTLALNDTIGPSRPAIFQVQIERTIEQHMEMQERLLPQGIKVLSLFFIDRVANYTDENGLIKRLFDEAFHKLKGRYAYFRDLRPEDVREAYFAKSKEGRAIDTESRTTDEREAERSAFELIMRQKEQLLSLSEHVCFIFAHSALREGWDNPNVFQICTLNQTVSEVKKRQEIGRGLRLCVNQEGERLFGDEVNIPTVVANESYQSYAANLQQEYVESGDAAPPASSDARKRQATRNDRIFRESTEFKAFWERLAQKVQYQVAVDTPALIERCAYRLNRESFPAPMVVVEKGDFIVTRYTFKLESVSQRKVLITIEILNTRGETTTISRYFQERDDLSRILREDRLRGFKILTIVDAGDQSRVCFENARELDLYTPFTFESEAGQRPRERASLVPETTYPVFNLLDRAAHETGLTRSTVNMIFKRLLDAKKQMLLKNPEGFAGIFINTLNNMLADHLAERIEFAVEDGLKTVNLEELFPPKRPFPQRELIEAGERGLYDQVQVDFAGRGAVRGKQPET